MQVAVRHELGHDAQVASVHTRAKQLGKNGNGEGKKRKKEGEKNQRVLPNVRRDEPLYRRG